MPAAASDSPYRSDMRRVARLAVAALLSGSPTAAALAQEGSTAQVSGWNASCVSEGRTAPARCQMEQRIVLQQGNRTLLTVKVEMPAEPRRPALLFQMPLGLHLPSGVVLKLDQGQPQQVAIQSCDPNGCYAGMALEDPLLAGLKAGDTLQVTLHNLAGETIEVPVPLAGFSAAYARIE